MEVPCRLNLAAVALRRQDYPVAVAQCDEILKTSPDNAKALFRRGQARCGLAEYDGALEDLARAREVEPADRSVLTELARVRKLRQRRVDEEKALYSRMFK